ncbi:hypothetical protein FBU30_009691 [Linnemannia zychae]|nr:hypothetical protein FBU30_009691 [Linnemannia zychae]
MTSPSHKIYTRIITQVRPRSSLLKRHQSTFSFFIRSQDSIPSPLASDASVPRTTEKDSDLKDINSEFPQYPHALKTSSSYASAAPLLTAIQNKDRDTAFMVYSVLSRAGQLSSLLHSHHTLLLQSIRPKNPLRFTADEVNILKDRLEQVWNGMLQCNIQPDMNDYMARLEFFVATKQFHLVDSTWLEMRQKSAGSNSSNGPLIQPTVHTYNLILKSCVPRKDIGLAISTINRMRKAGIKPDTMSWDYILQIHTAMKNWEAVESTFRANFVTASIGATGSQHSPGNFLNGGVSITKPHKTAKSNDKDKLIPSLQNIHTLFSYYAYTQDLDNLRAMFDTHVRLFGLVPTTKSYNEMIKFAFLTRRDSDAMDLFRELVQVGQNLERIKNSNNNQEQEGIIPSTETFKSSPGLYGPDFHSFKALINNELIASRNRWGRARKWIQVMQELYNIEPSDAMFRRTLLSMRRKHADTATIQALQENWDLVRARREGRAGKLSQTELQEEGVVEEEELVQASSNH